MRLSAILLIGGQLLAPLAARGQSAAMLPVALAPASASNTHRSPALAGVLGALLPGAGHYYAGDRFRARVLLGLTVVGANLAISDGVPRPLSNAGLALLGGTWVASVVDAPRAAIRHNRQQHRSAHGASR